MEESLCSEIFLCCVRVTLGLWGTGSSSFRIPAADARIASANQTHLWNRGNLLFGGACIMDGLKRLDGELLYLQWTLLVLALWRFQATARLLQE